MTELSTHRKWGQFRFAVVGSLFTAPPDPGELGAALQRLSEKTWKHPVSGEDVQFAFSTIESWYYRAHKEKNDQVTTLNSQARKDRGKWRSLDEAIGAGLKKQYAEYPWWTVQLHAKNLKSYLQRTSPTIPPPSYSSVRRYMKSEGLHKKSRPKVNERGELDGLDAVQTREVACFEAEHVNQIWSLDFHTGKLRVLLPSGEWVQPKVAAILDHYSRVCCHAVWGLFEDTIDLVHCYSTAVMKRGRPGLTLSDNGSAMKAGEFVQGLKRLGIRPRKTRPRTPRENGKTEHFWTSLEGELISMVVGQENLTLEKLNKLTQAWVEIGYNRRIHREIGERPIDRLICGRNVGMPAVDEDTLRRAFRIEETRSPRASDGTIRIADVLFRLPHQYRHLRKVIVRYARWDLGFIHLVDSVSGKELERIYPVDKVQNATTPRRLIESPIDLSQEKTRRELPELLEEHVKSY